MRSRRVCLDMVFGKDKAVTLSGISGVFNVTNYEETDVNNNKVRVTFKYRGKAYIYYYCTSYDLSRWYVQDSFRELTYADNMEYSPCHYDEKATYYLRTDLHRRPVRILYVDGDMLRISDGRKSFTIHSETFNEEYGKRYCVPSYTVEKTILEDKWFSKNAIYYLKAYSQMNPVKIKTLEDSQIEFEEICGNSINYVWTGCINTDEIKELFGRIDLSDDKARDVKYKVIFKNPFDKYATKQESYIGYCNNFNPNGKSSFKNDNEEILLVEYEDIIQMKPLLKE